MIRLTKMPEIEVEKTRHKDETMTSQIERMSLNDIADSEMRLLLCRGEIINLAETFIFLAESFIFLGRNVHEIRDDSAKNCGRIGSWPNRPVTGDPTCRAYSLSALETRPVGPRL